MYLASDKRYDNMAYNRLGASGLKLVKYLLEGGTFMALEVGVLFTGMAVAFVVSMLCIGFLMQYVKKHTFKPFGWYRIALGLVVLAAEFLK